MVMTIPRLELGSRTIAVVLITTSIFITYVVFPRAIVPKPVLIKPLIMKINHGIMDSETEVFSNTPDYTQTEGFVSMCDWNRQDGVTISLQHIWSSLAMAMLINRTFILSYLPASTAMGDANKFLPFSDLFDINILRKAYGPNCCTSPDEIDKSVITPTRTEGDSYRLLQEFKDNKAALAAHKHIRVCGTPFDFVAKANITSVYENTQPHPTLKKIIRYGSQLLHSNRTASTNAQSNKKPAIICMHLRTEPDFMHFFGRAPATYTREQILIKMNLTRIKYPGSTLAKLWVENANYEGKPILYLAGGDVKDRKEFFRESGWFSTVEDKDTLYIHSTGRNTTFAQLFVKYQASSSLISSLQFDVSTVLAIIDLEICKKADIFIGNNHSSLSERVATERQRSKRWGTNGNHTLDDGGRYNYMVNALAKDADSWSDVSKLEPLHPFCTANSHLFLSYKCNYVRSPM